MCYATQVALGTVMRWLCLRGRNKKDYLLELWKWAYTQSLLMMMLLSSADTQKY